MVCRDLWVLPDQMDQWVDWAMKDQQGKAAVLELRVVLVTQALSEKKARTALREIRVSKVPPARLEQQGYLDLLESKERKVSPDLLECEEVKGAPVSKVHLGQKELREKLARQERMEETVNRAKMVKMALRDPVAFLVKKGNLELQEWPA